MQDLSDSSPKSQFAYFEKLENTTKITAALYLFLLLLGMALTLGLAGSLASAVHESRSGLLFMAFLGFLLLYWVMYQVISKLRWLGEIHIWLDRNFFGFLNRSNEAILHTLLFALEPEEQDDLKHLTSRSKHSILASVFSTLGSDDTLFEALLRSDIFRLWIWYWVTNYGTFTFSLLTVSTFLVDLSGVNMHARVLFSTYLIVALAHLAAALLLGFRLVNMTRSIAEDILKFHRREIATMLRRHISAQLSLHPKQPA